MCLPAPKCCDVCILRDASFYKSTIYVGHLMSHKRNIIVRGAHHLQESEWRQTLLAKFHSLEFSQCVHAKNTRSHRQVVQIRCCTFMTLDTYASFSHCFKQQGMISYAERATHSRPVHPAPQCSVILVRLGTFHFSSALLHERSKYRADQFIRDVCTFNF